jgi:hypothetical protein
MQPHFYRNFFCDLVAEGEAVLGRHRINLVFALSANVRLGHVFWPRADSTTIKRLAGIYCSGIIGGNYRISRGWENGRHPFGKGTRCPKNGQANRQERKTRQTKTDQRSGQSQRINPKAENTRIALPQRLRECPTIREHPVHVGGRKDFCVISH